MKLISSIWKSKWGICGRSPKGVWTKGQSFEEYGSDFQHEVWYVLNISVCLKQDFVFGFAAVCRRRWWILVTNTICVLRAQAIRVHARSGGYASKDEHARAECIWDSSTFPSVSEGLLVSGYKLQPQQPYPTNKWFWEWKVKKFIKTRESFRQKWEVWLFEGKEEHFRLFDPKRVTV